MRWLKDRTCKTMINFTENCSTQNFIWKFIITKSIMNTNLLFTLVSCKVNRIIVGCQHCVYSKELCIRLYFARYWSMKPISARVTSLVLTPLQCWPSANEATLKHMVKLNPLIQKQSKITPCDYLIGYTGRIWQTHYSAICRQNTNHILNKK